MSSLGNFVKRLRDIMRNDAGINGDAQRIEQIAWLLFLKVYDTKEEDWEFDDDNYESIIPEECRWRNWAVDDGKGTAITGDALLDFINNKLFPTLKNIEVSKTTPINKAIVKTTFEDTNNYMKDGVLLRQVVNVIDELQLTDYEESHAFGEIYESILKELQSAGSAGEFYTPRAVTDFMAQMIRPVIGEKMADFACGTGGFITSWLKALESQKKTIEDREAFDTSVYGIEKKQFPYMLCVTNLLLHDIDTPRIYHDNSLLKDVLDYTEDDQFDVILMNPPYGGSEKNEVKNHFPSDLASSETADLFMSVIMYRLKQNGRAAVILPDGFLFGTDNAKVAIKKKLLSEFNLHTVIRMPHSVFAPYTSITTNILFFDRTGSTKETWFYRLDMPDGYKNFSKTKPMKLEHFAPAIEWWNNREEIIIDGFNKAKKYTFEELSKDKGYNIDLCGFPHEEEEILPPKELIQQYQEKRASLNADIDRILEQITGILGISDMEDLT
ncbi:MAG: SAM-dependent DNA methyltransferase [Ruminococcus sp.]|nr:SAM-dependent DNA methyltransferase [Ruminococcus sp.]